MTICEVRKRNLETLISEYGSLRALAESIGHTSTAQISQWRKSAPDSKTGKPRVVSNKSARNIELKCGKPEGWMDELSHTTVVVEVTPQAALAIEVTWLYENISEAGRCFLRDVIHSTRCAFVVDKDERNNRHS